MHSNNAYEVGIVCFLPLIGSEAGGLIDLLALAS
jgi:hypothetical protein